MNQTSRTIQSRLIIRATQVNHKVISNLCYYSFFLITVLSMVSCSSSQKKTPPPPVDSIHIKLPAPAALNPAVKDQLSDACQRWYDSILDNPGFNGGILVAKGGNIIFEKYKGNGHVGSNDSITNTTPFHIASVSKTITAMSILKLWQDGKLNIDDEYSKYFPTFNFPGITIRSLLDHRSGLPNYLYFMEELGWDKSVYIKNQDVFDYLVNRKSELDIGAPDRNFTYCNTNYALLALLAEKISGLPFPQFIQKEFFIPLNMTHSFVFTREDSSRVIPSYDWRGQMIPLNFLDLVYGDKNIYSTAEDLLIWDRALSTNLLFKPETLLQAYTPYSNEKPGIRNYGLGWRMNVYPNEKKMIYHNGWWHGYNASFIRLIEEDATIIIMGNRFTKSIYKSKTLAPILGAAYVMGEDEENESSSVTNTVNAVAPKTKTKRKRTHKKRR